MLAVIGGTGFRELAGLGSVRTVEVATSFGTALLQYGTLAGKQVVFMSRHGTPAHLPPHRINYRANIQALADAEVSGILAITAVGSVDASLRVPELVVPDQIIDYTWGRAHTFFDDAIHHIDFSFPYDDHLRVAILAAAARVKQSSPALLIREGGVYGCTQGPRLESAAEIRRLEKDGCHIVGMTGMPELVLACERGVPYAGLSVVVNAGAGIGGRAIDMAGIGAAMETGMNWARDVVIEVVAA